MNEDILKGKWRQIKGSIQERWGELTNDELDQINGEREQIVGKLQEKYGYTREKAEKELDEHLSNTAQNFNGVGINEDMLKGKWRQFKGAVQERWGELTNDDLDQINGEREQIIGKLQERYGYAREKAEAEYSEFVHRMAAPVH